MFVDSRATEIMDILRIAHRDCMRAATRVLATLYRIQVFWACPKYWRHHTAAVA